MGLVLVRSLVRSLVSTLVRVGSEVSEGGEVRPEELERLDVPSSRRRVHQGRLQRRVLDRRQAHQVQVQAHRVQVADARACVALLTTVLCARIVDQTDESARALFEPQTESATQARDARGWTSGGVLASQVDVRLATHRRVTASHQTQKTCT